MANFTSPCVGCKHEEKCNRFDKCKRWKEQYFFRQKLINAYAERVLPAYYASLKEGGDVGGSK